MPERPAHAQVDQIPPEELDAERRTRELLILLDEAHQLRVSLERLEELETAYQQEVLARDAALRALGDER